MKQWWSVSVVVLAVVLMFSSCACPTVPTPTLSREPILELIQASPEIPTPTPTPTPNKTETIHEGDLIVREGQELVIQDEILQVNGDLIAQPGSKVSIRNSTLIIALRYKAEHQIRATDASVEVVDSEIRSTEEIVTGEFGKLSGPQLMLSLNRTTFKVDNSELYCRVHTEFSSKGYIRSSVVSYVYWGPDTEVELIDSLIGLFVFDLKRTRPERLTFDGLEKGKNIDFFMKTNDGGSIKLQNSTVKIGWNFNLDYACKKDITIKNSEVELFWIKFPPTEERIKITGLKRGYLSEFTLDEHVEGIELPYNLRIVNSTLQGCFKPEMLGTTAEITNSHIMVHPYDEADLIIRNSTATTFFNYGSKRVEFIDTELVSSIQLLYKEELKNGLEVNGEIIGPGGNFHLIFRNSRINVDHIIVACGQGRIEGEVEVISPERIDDVHWFKGIVERTYPVIVKSASGEPVENAEVVIGLGESIKATTNRNGEALVTIQFDKENYDKVYTIEVCYEENKLAEEITFLSSTPVVFTIPPLPAHTPTPAPVPTPTPTSKPFNWLPIVGILGGVIVVALLVFLLRRRRAA